MSSQISIRLPQRYLIETTTRHLPFIEEKEMWIETEFREDWVYDEKSIIEV